MKMLKWSILNLDELAVFLDPDTTFCLFEPVKDVDVKVLEKMYFKQKK